MAFRNWFARGKEQPAKGQAIFSRMIETWLVGRPLPANDDYEKLCEEGYRRNAVLYGCVQVKAAAFAEPRLVAAERAKEGVEPLAFDHELQALLERPNPDMDQYEFLEMLGMHYEIAGEYFVHKVRSGSNKVVQLWPLRPDRVSPIPGADGMIVEYEYKIGTATKKIPAADVLHNCRPDPVEDYRGLSPIHVAARAIDMDNSAIDFLRTFFLNGGMPKGILKLKGTVDASERDKVRKKWTDQYGGNQGWHTTAVLDGDAEYQEVGAKPDELDMGSFFDVSETRICQVYGVPPILVAARIGINRATYSNYASARTSFWQDTMSPIFRRGAAAFTRGIAREFGPDYVCQWDTSQVAALQENLDTLWTRALLGWNAGMITLNESRVMVRLPRIEGGDIRKADMAGLGFDEPVTFEPSTTNARKVPKDLRELAEQLRLTIPELQKVVDRAEPSELEEAA